MKSEQIVTISADKILSLLDEFSSWSNTTTIIIHEGSVFEFKGVFPKGSVGHGYYNLSGETGFEGHLNYQQITEIELHSGTHMGHESHCFNFKRSPDSVVFKVFLGRDQNGNLHPEQLDRFNAIKEGALDDTTA